MPSYKTVFPDKWLHAEVINGFRPRVTIEHVAIEQLFNSRTKKNEAKLVVKFYKKELRLICNKTQATALATICNTEDYTRWEGHEVVLSTGKAPNGMDTILISPVPDAPPVPAPKPTSVPEPTDFDDNGTDSLDITIDPDTGEILGADKSLWEPNEKPKAPDGITPPQLLRLTKLMAQLYGADWGRLEPKLAQDASTGTVSQFSHLKVKEAEVLLRKLEAGIKQAPKGLPNGKVTA